MPPRILSPALGIALTISCLSLVQADSTAETGFESIFDGVSLQDWDGLQGAWTVEDGAIVCTGQKEGQKNWLIWRGADLGDFELRLEYRFTSGNSGVQVRSKELEEFQVRGYQVEIAAPDKMGLWHHSLSPEKYRSHLATAGQQVVIAEDGEKATEETMTAEKAQSAVREEGWNELVVIAKGPTLTQYVNGVELAKLTDKDSKYAARSGVLAFQDHGKGTVAAFRNIRLKRLE